MKRAACALLSAGTLAFGFAVTTPYAQRAAPAGATAAQSAAPRPTPSASPLPVASHATLPTEVATPAAQTALVKQYCVGCHSERGKAGGLSLATWDAAAITSSPVVAEKMIRKLRAGMMPPAGARRPEPVVLTALAEALEARMDRAAALAPNPGFRPSQRMNRAEYANAIRELLGLDIDVAAYLPPDTLAHGFDNISEEQAISSALMEGYLRAASAISRLAVGDRHASNGSIIYKLPRDGTQMRHVPGAPVGTRGGISVVHVFPADGEYVFKMLLHSGPTGDLFGSAVDNEQIEVSINGERKALLTINRNMKESDEGGLGLQTGPIHVAAGPQRVSAAFIQRADGPIDDLVAPIEHTLADTNIGETFGVTALAHLREFAVTGPGKVTGVSETPVRRRIFTCRPTTAAEETPCAAEILKRLSMQAYRGVVPGDDFADLMRFFEEGRRQGDFESGIRLALQAMLANPRFVFRLEQAPPALRAGQTYRIGDLDLASRLSFFLWGTVPDAELVQAARTGVLKTRAGLDKQVRRMLADPRAEAVALRFGAQWLRLQDIEKNRPDPLLFPHWDDTLADGFRRETELFFDSLVREDRSVLDLLTADYTFVNERIAKHYGIPNVMGNGFRRVTLTDPARRGILGHGSILQLTSIADRTSPVLRGKWVMEVLLGTPPPPPPPDVPDLEQTMAVKEDRVLSVRERMEQHRANPACTSCHKVIDPLGLALENFDSSGKWRIKDGGVLVDPTGVMYDGTPINGPADLRAALLKHKDAILLSFTESLMTYALGRPVEYYDMPAVRSIVRNAAKDGYRMSAFISGVVNSDAFRMARVTTAETTESRRE
jgi:mono/diheme cytochrome c family protein